VSRIADGIPMGQPILVGHHSERHARRDAEKIQSGMRKAVNLWSTSQYWEARAKGALRHAEYKERPDVRARRIKGLESDLRKQEKNRKESSALLKLWQMVDDDTKLKKKSGEASTLREKALFLTNHNYVSRCFPLAEFPRDPPASQYEGSTSYWSAINDNIITAEQARDMLIPFYGRSIAHTDRWIAHYQHRIAYEKAMLTEAGGTVADKKGPEAGGGCKCWASPRNGWSYIKKVNKVSVTVLDNWGNGGGNFTRTIPFDKLSAVMSAAEVQEKRDAGLLVEMGERGFGLLSEPPKVTERQHAEKSPDDDKFQAMSDTLKAGVKVVCAPQLFPTPPDIAALAVECAAIENGHRVLEPSAGSGQMLGAICHGDVKVKAVAIEINVNCAQMLQVQRDAGAYDGATIICADFLEQDIRYWAPPEPFDRVVMNPPFENGADIKHVMHALEFLKPGGRLVAIVANGPRQQEKLKPLAADWLELPPGSFKDAGTNVNTAIVVIDKN
jgi:protein-L-isoaspartate O-methyltransferase